MSLRSGGKLSRLLAISHSSVVDGAVTLLICREEADIARLATVIAVMTAPQCKHVSLYPK
jgi:hypothetical protein